MGLLFNIAIDGSSSSGKSTIAKLVAIEYKMRYIDSGAMYRAITLLCIENNIIVDNKVNHDKLKSILEEVKIDFFFDLKTRKSLTLLNNIDVEDFIRSPFVSEKVSVISQISIVRKKLIRLQQDIGREGNVIMDGRDIGSKVFPSASLKFFVIADINIRADRRLKQMKSKGYNISLNQVVSNLKKRDYHDINRSVNPLIQSEDAILINNSNLSIEKQMNIIRRHIDSKK